MAKPKAPLLSLGAHGTLGDIITYQKRGLTTIARKKPTPTDRKTLPQIYHRWLYQDYVAWWLDQSVATQKLWEKNARPHHMTGFAYWMKDRLTNLPDIAGAWHLDERAGLTAIDFSKNSNHGTIYGATHVPGHIDYALSFDGIDDRVDLGNDPTLNLTDIITFEAWIKPSSTGQDRYIYDKGHFRFKEAGNKIYAYLTLSDNLGYWTRTSDPVGTDWLHLIVLYDKDDPIKHCRLYFNGVEATYLACGDHGNLPIKSVPDRHAYLASYALSTFWAGLIDEVRISNRALTEIDAQRHTERRYPQ